MEEARQHPALSRWSLVAGLGRLGSTALIVLGVLAVPLVGALPLIIALTLWCGVGVCSMVVSVVEGWRTGTVTLYWTFHRTNQSRLFWGVMAFDVLMVPLMGVATVVLANLALGRL